jgi:hypothetical protein
VEAVLAMVVLAQVQEPPVEKRVLLSDLPLVKRLVFVLAY